MDLDETFSRSELVLQGTVVTGTSGETSKGEIFTDWIIDVERTFWGPGETERTIRLPGGVLATGRGTMIPDWLSVKRWCCFSPMSRRTACAFRWV
jgi:hypothetical protein